MTMEFHIFLSCSFFIDEFLLWNLCSAVDFMVFHNSKE